MADELYKLPAVEHPLTEETVRNIVTSMRKFGTGQNVMVDGVERSQSYIPGVQGWQIDAEGNAEFNNGTFRGRFDIGGTTITIDNTDDIQENIDIISNAGGGTLYLQTGTYTLTADVSIPSGVKLQGVSRDGVILDCNASYKVKIVGSNAYTTGTVTISVGDTTVVGSGTTFTSAMVGRHILLGEKGDFLWYEITAFTDTTHITIGSPYTGPNLSGDTYTIATINSDATIGNLTISGATAEGLKMQYALEPIVDNIYVLSCGTGLDFDQVVFPLLYLSAFGNGVNANWNEVSGYEVRFSAFDDSTSGNGITMTSCGNATFFDSSASGNTGDGINMTNCNFNTFVSNSLDSNGGQGIELVSGCDDNQFIATNPNGNTSDGFKFTATSDRNTIIASSITNNGGYGVNIAASTCDDNQITSPAFTNNSSGNINDSGTNTTVLPSVNTFTAAQDLVLGDPVGIANGNDMSVSIGGYTFKTFDANFGANYTIKDEPIVIDTNKIVLLLENVSTNVTYAVVGTISLSSLSISFGNIVTVTGSGEPASSIALLDTNKFIISFVKSGATDISCVIGTVSGTTITLNTVYDAGLSSFTNMSATLSVRSGSTSTAMLVVGDSSGTLELITVGMTISGTVITFGSAVQIATVASSTFQKNANSAARIGTNKYAVFYYKTTANTGHVVVLTQSGTTMTVGTPTSVGSGENKGEKLNSNTTDAFIFGTINAGTTKMWYATVSGTTITLGSALTTASGTNSYYYNGSNYIIKQGSDDFGWNEVSVSGTTLTFSSNPQFYIGKSTNFIYTNGYAISVVIAGSTGQSSTLWTTDMSNNFIGIVTTSSARGGTVNVKMSGRATVTQNLSVGDFYYLSDGVLTRLTTVPAIASQTIQMYRKVTASGINEVSL